MKRKFAFGVDKVVIETHDFNKSVWKCFENSTPVDAPSPPSTVISPVRTNGSLFKVFPRAYGFAVPHICLTFTETLHPHLHGTPQRAYCPNKQDKH